MYGKACQKRSAQCRRFFPVQEQPGGMVKNAPSPITTTRAKVNREGEASGNGKVVGWLCLWTKSFFSVIRVLVIRVSSYFNGKGNVTMVEEIP